MKGKEACGADEWDGAADTDIERAVSASRCREPGRPSVDIDRELACGPVAQKSTESRVPHPPVAEGEHDKARQQAYSRSDGSSVVQTAARGLVSSFEWDVFISYRVAADAELVKDIFWQLNSCVVTENGKSRRIRVFWDRQCLLAGEPWEEGFSKALCSSRLVLMVMSKKAYVMEGRHNVEAIMEASPCDNVLLEACLSLFLHQTRSTAILPLFVGERSGPSGSFSHFFESGCMPMCPDLVVSEIHEKALYHLGRHTGIGQDDMPSPRTIRDTLADIIKFQVHLLS